MNTTPGPWIVRTREDSSGNVLDCFVQAPSFQGYAYGSEILGDDEYREGGMERKLADCRLIAAAPELLAVIPRLLAVINDFMPNVGRCALQNYRELNEAPNAARAALTKATGI